MLGKSVVSVWYRACNLAISAVMIFVDYGGVYVFVVYGVGFCVDVCSVVCLLNVVHLLWYSKLVIFVLYMMHALGGVL